MFLLASFLLDGDRRMSPVVNRRHTVESLFCDAMDLPSGDRYAYLANACVRSPELLQPVLTLLAEQDRAGSFLQMPILRQALTPSSTPLIASGAASAPVTTPAHLFDLSPRFSPGQVLADRFAIVRFLARGGMGEVYEAEDRLLQGEHVALKTIRPEIAEEQGSSARFEQEVLLARKVHHPNLCPIYELFRCEQPAPAFLFLTMKLLGGETLDVQLQEHSLLSRAALVEISTRLMAGVSAIHAAGIVHRDIKPKNVMLERSGRRLRLYLLDFGLARLHHSDATVHRTGMVAGTPGYLAPELLRGQQPTRATDLFALGVVLHQVLCGTRPMELPDGISLAPAPELHLANVPAYLIEAVEGLLSTDPEQRCAAFRLARAAHRIVTPAVPVRQPQRLLSPLSRRTFALGSLCAAGTAIGWQHSWIYDSLHPLPRRRFVALLDWPPAADAHLRPMILGLIDAIASELARAEASDRDLLVVPQTVAAGQSAEAAIRQARESVGANLVLAASGHQANDRLALSLQLLDSGTGKTLRSRELRASTLGETTFAAIAVRAASELLDIRHFQPNEQRLRVGTDQPAALAAFQAAEVLVRQDDDAGLDSAILKYREAAELDPRYALAFAKLSQAYTRSFVLSRDTGALHLANANADHALALNHDLVEGQMAIAAIMETTGDEEAALQALSKVLASDPGNTRALRWQAEVLRRLNRWPEAERTFHRVISQRPNLWLNYNELGFGLHGQGRWMEAIEAFKTAAVTAPGNAMAAANLGSEYLQVGAVSDAIKSLRRALALKPNDDEASACMSLALRQQKRVIEALPFALRATIASPEVDTNWLELGECYAALPHHEPKAREAFLHAVATATRHLRSDSTDGPAWMLLALYQAKVGDIPGSTVSLTRADALKADDMDSLLYRIRVLELLGHRDDALASLKKAFARGATAFQINSSSDLNSLRLDPRYRSLETMQSTT